MKLVSTAEMQQVEREADANGLSYEMMMEHAGSGLAEQAHNHYKALREGGVLGLVGSGNNGGDTLVALAKMADWGWNCEDYKGDSHSSLHITISALEGLHEYQKSRGKLRIEVESTRLRGPGRNLIIRIKRAKICMSDMTMMNVIWMALSC